MPTFDVTNFDPEAERAARRAQAAQDERTGPYGHLTSITAVLPLPGQNLGKNGRAQWWTRHSAFQDAKTTAYLVFRGACPGVDLDWAGPVRVHVQWVASYGPMPDRDNAIMRCAAFLDGAQAAHVIVNDKQVQSWDVQFSRDIKNPFVGITIERILTGEEPT